MRTVTFAGNQLHLLGNEIKVGDVAPDFTVLSNDLNTATLHTYPSCVRILSSVPSIDTGVCSFQTRKFNQEAGRIEGLKVLTISCDLPFAQGRWCAAEGLDHVVTLSDHRDLSFGEAYGVVLQELRLLARAVFVVDSSDRVVYVEYVPEVTDHPDYDKALEAAMAAM